MNKLLPPDFDSRVHEAVKRFWTGRLNSASMSQAGGRASVIGGKNLDGFADIIQNVALSCGIPDEDIIVSGRANLTIPGYFRPTKMWDSIVLFKGRLVAAFELKSQVGPSFGNNFNNRSEESIGSATDFWTAHRENVFLRDDGSVSFDKRDSKPPFLGYLVLLEDCPSSTSAVKVDEVHFKTFPEFKNSSYAQRYTILIERLVAERLYTSGCLMLSERESGANTGEYSSPKDTLSPRSLFADFVGYVLAAKETY